MPELRRNAFRMPEEVDRVVSVRPRWLGEQVIGRVGVPYVRDQGAGRPLGVTS